MVTYEEWRLRLTKGWQLKRINDAYATNDQAEITKALQEVMFYRNPLTSLFIEHFFERSLKQ